MLRQRVLQLESDVAHAQQSSARDQSTGSLPQPRGPRDELAAQPSAAAAEAANAAEGRPHSWQAEQPGEVAEAERRIAIGQAGGLQPTASEQAAEELSSHRASDLQQAGSGLGKAALEGADRQSAAAEQQSQNGGRFMDPPASLNRTNSYSSAESVHCPDAEGNLPPEAIELGPRAWPPITTAATPELARAQAPAVQHVLDAEIPAAKLVHTTPVHHNGELDTRGSATPLTDDTADLPTAVAQQTAPSEAGDVMLPCGAECRAAAAAGVATIADPAAVPPLAAPAAAPEPWPAQEGAPVPPALPGDGELETPFGDSAAEGSCQEAEAAEGGSGLPLNSAGDGGIAHSDARGSSIKEGEYDGASADQDVPEASDGDARLPSSDQLSEQQTGATAESVGLSETAAVADVAPTPPAVTPGPATVSTKLL